MVIGIGKENILHYAHLYQKEFNRDTSFTDDELVAMVDEVKLDWCWIMHEGLWAWVVIKMKMKENRKNDK